MSHVDEISPKRVDFGNGFEGLVDGEMGWVRAITQGIEDEGFGGLELGKGMVGDVGNIGAIGEGEKV